MQVNNRWTQFKSETTSNTFKKPKQNSRWKEDTDKNTNFKQPFNNSRFSNLKCDDNESERGDFRNSERRGGGRFSNLKCDDDDDDESERGDFRNSERREGGRFRDSERRGGGRFEDSERRGGGRFEDSERREGGRFRDSERQGNHFKNNGRFRNNRSFDKRPTRITRNKNGELLLPGSTIKNTNIFDSITTKQKQNKESRKENKKEKNSKKKKKLDLDFFAEEEKINEKKDIEWQKALLLQMQCETDSEEEDEEFIEDNYDELSKDNFTQKFL